MNTKKLFNDNWVFTKQALHTSLDSMKTKDINWQPVSLPHDWLIYDTNNLYETGDGWYRKEFQVDKSDGRRRAIRFEGVYMDSKVFVNGELAGVWKYGYSTFEFDITDLLVNGNNEIMVQVSYQSPNSRWYSGAGIYRNVWLKTYPETHIISDGIYIAPKKEDKGWIVNIDTEVMVASDVESSSNIKVKHEIIDKDDRKVAFSTSDTSVNDFDKVNSQVILVTDPNLWDLDNPYLYKLKTELYLDDQLIGQEIQNFGFRTLEFTRNDGFFINGKHMKLYGVCQHHDLGALGSAVNKSALRRQMSILKEMGVNSIRTAHNMPAVELMELADEMGMLIQSESFDMWERPKTKYDYGNYFNEWVDKDVASWIRRDRNHPSVIMWCIGNEVYDTHAGERGQELTKMLMDMVHEHDYHGNAPVTLGSNYMPWENTQKCADIIKLIGYNYGDKYYEDHHKDNPDWIIYGSETGSTVQSRGIYHFPLAKSLLADDDEQCSSLGNSSTSWGAASTEANIIADRDAPFSLGQYIWSGFDYIGEPTPYHTKSSYFGQIDTAGFRKDSSYIYQSAWTDYKEKPMVHIFPYWDFSDGQLIDVRVCSNAPKVELFFNEESQGTFDIDHEHGSKLIGDWQIPYSKGQLKALAYDEDGKVIAEDIVKSFGDPASLHLTPDKRTIKANGSDICFIEISTKDLDGTTVENANNRVQLSLEGPGVLVGLDNGDSTDFDQYKGTSRRLFSGRLLAMVSSTFEPGQIKVKVSSKGLEDKEILSEAVPGEIVEGSCQPIAYPESQINDEVPIRKIEIITPKGNKLDKDTPSLPVQVKLHPENATYDDIQWRVTDDAGIDSNIASIEKVSDNEVIITGHGDGRCYLRCLTTNGADKIRIYSHLEFEISGMGHAYLNPYEFISGGLYTYGLGLTNGNDRGMATARDGKSIISFEDIDFGDYGSDELTIPIFCLDNEVTDIELWEGIPGQDGAKLISEVTYQKPSIWNHYQEETYKLPRRLKGITTLSIVLYKKVHIKGFIFKKYEKAFEKLSALDNNNIYGDTFTIKEDAIESIGNNVSLVFEDMDFGQEGCSKITICGHSPIDKNTIHVLFSGDEDTRRIIEFTQTDDYEEKEFTFDKVTGKNKLTFVFLPGSNFNFKWFKFQ